MSTDDGGRDDETSPRTEAEIRAIVADEVRAQQSSSTRRNVLKALGLGGAAAALGGTAGAQTGGGGGASLDVGSVTPNTYRIAGNRYGGPAAARSELGGELGSSDAGARFAADDTGAEYYWTGSGWEQLPVEAPAINTGNTVTERNTVTEGVNYGLSETNPHYPNGPEVGGPPVFREYPGVDNPIITAGDFESVTGDTTTTVFDSFGRWDDELQKYVITCEVITDSAIYSGYAYSDDLKNWTPQGYLTDATGSDIIGAFPFPFKWGGYWYLASMNNNLYRREGAFGGDNWENVGAPQKGFDDGQDVVFWRQNGRWWKVGANDPDGSGGTEEIMFLHSDVTEDGPEQLSWTEPSWSPLSGGDGTDKQAPAGRPWVLREGTIILHYQDESGGPQRISQYIYSLDTDSVTEHETGASPVFDGALLANSAGSSTHALDPIFETTGGLPAVVVDYNNTSNDDWGIGLATTAAAKPVQATLSKNTNQDIGNDFRASNGLIEWTGSGTNTWAAGDFGNDQFVIPEDGVYRVEANIMMTDHDSGGHIQALWHRNGNPLHNSTERETAASTRDVTISPSITTKFTEGDTLTLRAEIVSSATKRISGAGTDPSAASLTLLD